MRKRYTPLVSGLLAGTLLLQSCATIISGSRQSILISGQPAGSTIYVNDEVAVSRPAGADGGVRVRIPRKHAAEIKVKHEGYKDYHEVLTPDKTNGLVWLNYLLLPVALVGGLSISSSSDGNGNTVTNSNLGTYMTTLLVPIGGALADQATGANRRFSKNEVHPQMMPLPKAVAGGQTVQAGAISVRIKGGDKMGNFFVVKEPREILYFGKSLDVDADNLRASVNTTLKDLGFNVPSGESKSVFSTGLNSRYTVQGEMHEVKYDVVASHPYESLAHYETRCTVAVTWKLINQSRQTVYEHKDSGTAVKFEKGGSAAFADAFENSLYAFLGSQQVTTALAKPMGSAGADKPTAITLHRAAALKTVADNGVGAAAKAVVIIDTGDGHGSGCVVSADGYIVTNAHVVGDAEEVKVLLADGVSSKAKVVRVNSEMDLALIKIDADGLTAFSLPTASTADVGADVFAIGTPADKELGQTVTKGIISGRRKIDGHSFLQTDVSINGGNSGGALVAKSGQLLGIVNAKLVGRGIEGIGFAIPAEQVSDALQLKFVD